MMKEKTGKKQFVIYLAVAFCLAYVIEFIASYFALKKNDVQTCRLIIAGMMFVPFISVLAARIPLKGMGWIPHLKGKVRWIFFSLWMPVLLAAIGAALYFLIFPDHLDMQFETMRLSLGEQGMAQLEAQGLTIESYLIVSSIMAVTIYPFLPNMIVALGEEVGWRGAMYPYLKDRFGITTGRVIGGIIWGAWHWPLIILIGYEYGFDYFGAPVLGLVVFCCFTVVVGILEDYVYEKTGTIWIPSLLHGAINALTIFAYIIKPEYGKFMILGPAYNGLISMIPIAVIAILISIKANKSKPEERVDDPQDGQ